MIVEEKPELGLQEHQQEAYQAVTKAFKTSNRASVVMPTGCGKSFIALQLMEDNRDKRMLFMAPTEAIRNQMYQYIAKYILGEEPSYGRSAIKITEEHFPNFKIILYPALIKMKSELMEKLNPDIIIMDELHRTGADKWGKKVDELLDMNPEAKVLGLTATPDRMDDKEVVDRLFSGKIDYELTLVDAIRKGIVKPPSYVKCDYALGERLEYIKDAIDQCQDEKTRKELEQRYEKMRKIIERAHGIPELFSKHLPKKDGKYIVFCKDKEHMDEIMKLCGEWFREVDSELEIYSVYSQFGKENNKKQIKAFEDSKSDHLKLLFSVDMLNEGVHVEDISGVIMLRPTESRIIYLQQLGRALSSDTSRPKTIVFDLVNNYLKNNLDAEINEGRRKVGDREEGENIPRVEVDTNNSYEDIDIFRIQGETKELLELFEEAREILEASRYLINAREIKKWMNEGYTAKPPRMTAEDTEEKRLGNALARIRYELIKPYMELKTEEERKKYKEEHPELEEVLEIVTEIDRNNLPAMLKNAREIRKWMEERDTTKPPTGVAKDTQEQRLGHALRTIRQNLIKPYMELKTEEERKKYKEEHPELEEVLEIVTEIDRNNLPVMLKNAREIRKWMDERKITKPPSSTAKDAEEKRLGVALGTIRHELIKPYMELKTEEERKKYKEEHPELEEVLEIVTEIDRNNLPAMLKNARAIKKWMKENGTKRPPRQNGEDIEENRLGSALSTIRQNLIKPYMKLKTEEERTKYKEDHPELEEVLEIVEEIDKNNPRRRQLNDLIEENSEKRKTLEQARGLEQGYRTELDNQKGNEAEQAKKGCGIGE